MVNTEDDETFDKNKQKFKIGDNIKQGIGRIKHKIDERKEETLQKLEVSKPESQKQVKVLVENVQYEIDNSKTEFME